LSRFELPMQLWTIYDSPSDYRGKFVARLWQVTSLGPKPTEHIMVTRDLMELRRVLRDRGLVCIQRAADDDDPILETWL
jgi:hypothetical protein